MYKRLKLNVKNVISDPYGFARLFVPRSIPHRCKLTKQNCQDSTLFSKLPILKPLCDGKALKPISSQILPIGKWLNPFNTDGSFTQPNRFYHNPIRRFYYDVQTPQCPPPGPKPCASKESKESASSGKDCAKPKEDPCGGASSKKECPKRCGTRKMSTFIIPLNIYRHYSKRPPCPPRGGAKGGGGGKASGKGPICPPQKKVPDCSGGARKRAAGGSMCPPAKKVKDCPPKGGRRGGGAICPPPKKVKDCPPTGRGGGGGGGKRVCGPPKKAPPKCGPTSAAQKKRPKCPPSGGGGGGKSSKSPLIKRVPSCKPKGKSGATTGKSGRPKCPK